MAGFGVWCLPLSAVAPIEDGYFLQVDFTGSKRVLMPWSNTGATWVRHRYNAGTTHSIGYRFWCPVLPVPLFRIEVGQLQAPNFGALPYCPTLFNFLLCIKRKLKARMRAMGATTCPLCLRVHVAGKGRTVGQPSNDAARTCPTALSGSRTRSDRGTWSDAENHAAFPISIP
jgi:hypothetical protein